MPAYIEGEVTLEECEVVKFKVGLNPIGDDLPPFGAFGLIDYARNNNTG